MIDKKEIEELKMAVSAIQKKLTMMEGTGVGEQDGNIGQAVNGEQGYSDDFENVTKKKMFLKKMME
jgi:hypothetical protein